MPFGHRFPSLSLSVSFVNDSWVIAPGRWNQSRRSPLGRIRGSEASCYGSLKARSAKMRRKKPFTGIFLGVFRFGDSMPKLMPTPRNVVSAGCVRGRRSLHRGARSSSFSGRDSGAKDPPAPVKSYRLNGYRKTTLVSIDVPNGVYRWQSRVRELEGSTHKHIMSCRFLF
jgi:hypothetical protein